MADLASSDVTITVQTLPNGKKATIEGGIRKTLVKIAFGDAALTYPSGGVPLPAATSFGLQRSLSTLRIVDANDGSGINWKYDHENKKLRGYIPGAVISAAGAATLDDYALDGTADPLAAAARQPGNGVVSLGLGNTTAAGTVYFGEQKELLATEHAPAAQVLYAEAIGW
jgi:hypothetical protein